MPGLDALQSVQFISVKDQRFAVLSADDWEALVEWLETVEDMEIAREMLSELRSMNSDRLKAGWRNWEDSGQGQQNTGLKRTAYPGDLSDDE